MSALAAVVYPPEAGVDALLDRFAAEARAEGARVAGLVQINDDAACAVKDMALRDLASDRVLSICLDLGPGATGCRLDTSALATAAGWLREALDGPVDLVVVNKFGRLEAEGGGLVAEIGEAFGRGIPVVVGVPERFLAAWEAFAGGLDTRLSPEIGDLHAWLSRVRHGRIPLSA